MTNSAWTLALAMVVFGCSTPSANPMPAGDDAVRAGPESIVVPALSISTASADVEAGKAIFGSKGCPACHKLGGGKLVGPDLKGVTARRDTRWIERMILRPDIMLQQDRTARDLQRIHVTPMVNQNVNPTTELPALLAYLKANE
jgi:mono/diheme cytochrome c family protein